MLRAIYARPGEPLTETSSEADILRFHKEGRGTLWVDLEAPTDAERGILERVFNFHKLAIENAVQLSNHPRIDDYGDYLYLVVHGVSPTNSRKNRPAVRAPRLQNLQTRDSPGPPRWSRRCRRRA